MSSFWKILIALFTFLGIVIAALAIFDKVANKNRIKGDYLECDTPLEFEEELESTF